jgi:hypothetical protein
MERHAAVPDLDRIPRVFGPERQAIEQHVAQAAAEDGAQHAEEHEIVDVVGLPRGIRPAGPDPAQPPGRRESDQVHDSVPVDFQRPETAEGANLERDLVEAGVLDHAGRILAFAGDAAEK